MFDAKYVIRFSFSAFHIQLLYEVYWLCLFSEGWKPHITWNFKFGMSNGLRQCTLVQHAKSTINNRLLQEKKWNKSTLLIQRTIVSVVLLITYAEGYVTARVCLTLSKMTKIKSNFTNGFTGSGIFRNFDNVPMNWSLTFGDVPDSRLWAESDQQVGFSRKTANAVKLC